MPIKLFTGQTGAGKSALMVSEILKFREREPDRPVYVCNLEDASAKLGTVLAVDQLPNWLDLPSNSLICIDECNEEGIFPPDSGKPALWVAKLIKNRRQGVDFWITTVHPSLMSPYVRKLVAEHVHNVRKFKSDVIVRHQWPRCMDKCETDGTQKTAITTVGTLPKHAFAEYTSAKAHTIKRSIPFKAMMLPACAFLAIAALCIVPYMLKRLHQHAATAVTGADVQPSHAQPFGGSSVSPDASLRSTDFAKWMAPRIAGLPWTAPMFDDLKVQAIPRLFCVAIEDGRCFCNTEQGTRYDVPVLRCRQIVASGVYNPFQPDPQQQENRSAGATAAGKAQPPLPSTLPSDPVNSSASAKPAISPIATPYVPPTYGVWNPEAFSAK